MNVESSGAYNLTPLCQGRWVRIEASTPWQRLFSWFHTSRAVPCRVLLRLGVAQLPDRNQSCTKMTYSCRMTQMHLLHSSIKNKRVVWCVRQNSKKTFALRYTHKSDHWVIHLYSYYQHYLRLTSAQFSAAECLSICLQQVALSQ